MPNVPAYLRSWASELTARADRVRLLIGDVHWGSVGQHKEALIREFLSRYLPRKFVSARGFVKCSISGERCSPEIDILITDPLWDSPYFFEGDLQIVPPSSVAAQIEVKTTFSKSTVKEAIENVSRTQALVACESDQRRVWTAIFFYCMPDSRSADSVLSTVSEAIREVYAAQVADGCADALFLPKCIATLSPYLMFPERIGPDNVRIRLFNLTDLSMPCAFADLFAELRIQSGGV